MVLCVNHTLHTLRHIKLLSEVAVLQIGNDHEKHRERETEHRKMKRSVNVVVAIVVVFNFIYKL